MHYTTKFLVFLCRPGSLLVDFYLKFLSTISNPVQLLLNLLKTGFIGSIPVDKLPKRLYNGTGTWIGVSVFVVLAHRFRPKSR